MLEAASPHAGVKVLWSTLEYVGLAFTPTLFLIFVLDFSRLEKHLSKRLLGILAVFPILTIAMAATNQWHHWLWNSFTLDTTFNIMTYGHGPFFWLNAAYSYLLLIIATIILAWDAYRFQKMYQSQVWALLAAAFVPWVLNVIYIFDIVPQIHLDWTSLGFAITGIIFSFTIYRFQFLDLVPVARGIILDSLADGIVVLDSHNRVLDFNPAAQQFLGFDAETVIGQPASSAIKCCPEMETALQGEAESKTEIETGTNPNRFVEINVSPVWDHHHHVISKIALFRDVTARKHDDLRLLDALDFNQRIISTSPVGIMVYKSSGECILANEAASIITNATHADLLEQNFHQIQSWKKSGLYQMAETALSTGAARRGEVHHFSTFGREIWMDVSFISFPSGGEPHLLFLVNDITERKLIQEAEHTQRVLAEALRDTAQALNSSLDLEVILDRVLSNISRVMPYDSAEVFLFDETGNVQLGRVRSAAIRGKDEIETSSQNMERAAAGFETLRRVRAINQPIIIADVQNDPAWVAVNGFEWIRSHINVPLGVKGKVIGAIGLNSRKTGFFSEVFAAQIMAFANSAAIAIENARLYAEVQRLAITDELTGVNNYRALMEMGPREVERARRFSHHLSALFLDIDNFGEFNNRYSHMVGNQVLQRVARSLTDSLRLMDFVARYGGEEFVVLLPETPVVSARQTAERLRQEIGDCRVKTEWGDLGVSVSIGVAHLEPTMPDFEALIEQANRAEHLAKERGRNQVVMIGETGKQAIG